MLILLKFLEFRQMGRHFAIRKTFTISAVISHRDRQKMITHNTNEAEKAMYFQRAPALLATAPTGLGANRGS